MKGKSLCPEVKLNILLSLALNMNIQLQTLDASTQGKNVMIQNKRLGGMVSWSGMNGSRQRNKWSFKPQQENVNIFHVISIFLVFMKPSLPRYSASWIRSCRRVLWKIILTQEKLYNQNNFFDPFLYFNPKQLFHNILIFRFIKMTCKYSGNTRSIFYFGAKENVMKQSDTGTPKNCMYYSDLFPLSA